MDRVNVEISSPGFSVLPHEYISILSGEAVSKVIHLEVLIWNLTIKTEDAGVFLSDIR